MSIEDTIKRMQQENQAARVKSNDQTRRLIRVALGYSEETLDEILEDAEIDGSKLQPDAASESDESANTVVDIPGESDSTNTSST